MLVRALNEQVGGVNLDSASGNPYQPTLFYHGFEASALQGTPQGLAVYVNGVRFNQAFGDTVNFDLLPDMAIDQMNLEGSNPVFGLNALGGALNVQLKNGFTYQGGEIELVTAGRSARSAATSSTASRAAIPRSMSRRAGCTRTAGAICNPPIIENFYGDIGWRGNTGELHFNVLLANSVLNGPGTSPVELLAADPAAQFTGPNPISNRFMQVSLSGNLAISDTVSHPGRHLLQQFPAARDQRQRRRTTRHATTVRACCAPIPAPARRSAAARSRPSSARTRSPIRSWTTRPRTPTATAPRSRRPIRRLCSASTTIWSAASASTARRPSSPASPISAASPPITRVFVGPGVIIDEPGNNQPVRVGISDAYYGVFVADTFNVTDRLALTASGRFNAAADQPQRPERRRPDRQSLLLRTSIPRPA